MVVDDEALDLYYTYYSTITKEDQAQPPLISPSTKYMDLILDNVPNVFECHDAPQSIVVES